MKFPKVIYEYLKKEGIHPNPESLSLNEIREFTYIPYVRETLLQCFRDANMNFFQELEMESSYVDTHRDISREPETVRLHSHSFYEIIYCESGDVQYLIQDKRYHIHEGDVIFVPPGYSHRPLFYPDMKEPYSRIVLWINTVFFKKIMSTFPAEYLNQLHSKGYFLLHVKGTPYEYIESYFKQGILESEKTAPLWDTALAGNTISLITHLSRYALSTKGAIPAKQPELIDQIISYIEKHYSEKISLETAAKEFHISSSTLSKLFVQKLDIGFHHFVTQRRLINAKMRIDENYPLKDIAISCGFYDYTAFYRAFKKEFGITPGEYKKRSFENL